jgi:phosphoglycerate dehydrogenase-like enzyme
VTDTAPRIAIAPATTRGWLADAVAAGGGIVVQPEDATGLVWAETSDPGGLAAMLDVHPNLGWIQLPYAGVEPYRELIMDRPERQWTCGKGVYAEPVAEHALALALALFRRIGVYARARTWTRGTGHNLLGASVTIVGGGGIAESLLRLMGPFGCTTTVVRRHPVEMPGAARVVGIDALDAALEGAGLVVVALALTPETAGLMDRRRLDLIGPDGVLVNVARGGHVVTGDLVAALTGGSLGGAGLDVTDPEPLPDGHPLWELPNVIITPHTANTPEMGAALLADRVTDNVRRYAAGEPLVGPVDPELGY